MSTGTKASPPEPPPLPAGQVVVSLSNVFGTAGDEVRVPINVKNATGINPFGIGISLVYDSGIIDYVDDSSIRVERTALTGHFDFLDYAPAAGEVNISSVATGDALVGSGHLFDVYMTLDILAAIGLCGPLTFSSVSFYDENLDSIAVDTTDSGQICGAASCNQGDLNSDGAIDAQDVQLALNMSLTREEPSICQLAAADLNGDEVVDIADAVMVYRLVRGYDLNPAQPVAAKEAKPLKAGSINVAVGSVTAVQGTAVTVPVTIDDSTGLAGVDLTVGFSPDIALIRLDDAARGSLLGTAAATLSLEDDVVRMSACEATTLATGGGELLLMTFTIPETAPAGTVLPIRIVDVG